MKYDALFLGRIHYQDKDYREKNKLMEFVWKTSETLGKSFCTLKKVIMLLYLFIITSS